MRCAATWGCRSFGRYPSAATQTAASRARSLADAARLVRCASCCSQLTQVLPGSVNGTSSDEPPALGIRWLGTAAVAFELPLPPLVRTPRPRCELSASSRVHPRCELAVPPRAPRCVDQVSWPLCALLARVVGLRGCSFTACRYHTTPPTWPAPHRCRRHVCVVPLAPSR
eukprot:1152183-Prymnesium_polylepis.1